MYDSTQSNQLLNFLRRRWTFVALAAVVAIVGAAAYAQATTALTYTCVGTMLYNRAAPAVPHYQPPEVQSIAGLVKSQAVLAAVAKDFQPSPALKPLADSVVAEVLAGSGTLQFTMRGSDPERTRLMLERLMRAVVEHAALVRRRTVEGILVTQTSQFDKARADALATAGALAAFNAEHRIIVGVDDDLQRVLDEAAAVETAVETNRPEHVDPEEQLRRRRAALQEHLDAERAAIARASELSLKKNEFDRAARLHEKQYISDAEYRRIEAEYRALEAQNGAAVEDWRRRLAEIDRVLGDQLRGTTGETTPQGAATIAPTTADLSTRMRDFMARKHAEAERLNALRGEATRLEQAATASQEELRRTASLMRACEELRDAEFHDLVIVQPAAPAIEPPVSNKKKQFAIGLVGIFGGLVFPIFLWDLLGPARKQNQAAQAAGDDCDTAIERLPLIGSTDASEAVRAAALRIQQSARADGSVALLCRLDENRPATRAAAAIAECLTQRGERVLVVQTAPDSQFEERLTEQLIADADVSQSVVADWTGNRTAANQAGHAASDIAVMERAAISTAGLAELLQDVELRPADVIRRGVKFDCILAGQATFPVEAFAGRRLTETLKQLRHDYSTVLVIAPGFTQAVDWELSAARATAVVFTTRDGASPSVAALRAVENLTALGAPILGLAAVES